MHRIALPALWISALLPLAVAGQEPDLTPEVRTLQAHGLPTDVPGLLHFLRVRSEGKADAGELAALIDRLGDESPAVRRKAVAELIALGPPAVPHLRAAVKDSDRATRARQARACLEAIEEHSEELTTAAVRLLAERRPEGAVAALLDFLPNAESDAVLEATRQALRKAVGLGPDEVPPREPPAALLAALKDPLALRRAVALEILAAFPKSVPGAMLRKLLDDPSATVRLRVALALARENDAKAISVLITLLDGLPEARARETLDFLHDLAGEQAPRAPLGNTLAARRACRDAWAKWWAASEGEALLKELQKHTLGEEDRTRAAELIRQLGAGNFADREKAGADLKALGGRVLPLLRAEMLNPDLEVRRRVRALLGQIEKIKEPLSPVTLRLLALRKPAGAAEALLAYAPGAENEELGAAARAALGAVAYDPETGKAHPAIVAALASPVPARRAAAAAALCEKHPGEHLPAVRKLLRDPVAGVRYDVALALAGVPKGEGAVAARKSAVSTLIALIPELPTEESAEAEGYLLRLAAGRPPEGLPEGDGETERARRRNLWQTWWLANRDRVRIPDPRSATLGYHHGYTLLVLAGNSQVLEWDRRGKERWRITGLSSPYDAEVLPDGEVVVAEYSRRQVTRRDTHGKILWTKRVPGRPLNVQGLRGGRLFIACREVLLEVDRSGKEVFTIPRPARDVRTAGKTRDGKIVVISTRGMCETLNSKGKLLKSFRLTHGVVVYGNEIMPNGHVLMPMGYQNRVLEYNGDGKVVWTAAIQNPVAAHRLSNGHTLVVTQKGTNRVVELDRAGKVVKEQSAPGYVMRLKRR
jgi:HEAT repeat protein